MTKSNNSTKSLSLRNITKSFGGITAVYNLSMDVKPGTISGLIGPNGAGKTTVFNLVTGHLRLDSGSIFYGQDDITLLEPHEIVSKGLARTFQEVRILSKMRVIDNVLLSKQGQLGESFWGAICCRPEVKRQERVNRNEAIALLEMVGMADQCYELAESLSYGHQKLLVLARLLATGAEFLLLDEPTSGLGAEDIGKMLGALRKLVAAGKTILMIAHDMDVIMGASDWIYVLNEGKLLLSGTPTEIAGDRKFLEAYIGI